MMEYSVFTYFTFILLFPVLSENIVVKWGMLKVFSNEFLPEIKVETVNEVSGFGIITKTMIHP